MSNQTIADLRSTLFDTIKLVKDGKLDIASAKTISDLAQVVINSAKVEVDHLKVTGKANGSGFIPEAPCAPALPDGGHQGKHGQTVEQLPGGRRVTHRLQG